MEHSIADSSEPNESRPRSRRKLKILLEDLSLKDDDPVTFVTCQWQKDKDLHKYFIVYKWLHALYFVATFSYSICAAEPIAKYAIFLTNWGCFFCFVQSLWSLTLIMIFWSKQGQVKTYMGYRFFYVVALDVTHAITILYWTFVYRKEDELTANGLLVHAGNVIVMLIDFALVAHHINLLHVVYPVGVGTLYISFNICYYCAGGTGIEDEPYIYKVLDWRKAGPTTGIAMGSVLLVMVIHVALWGLEKLKKLVHGYMEVKKSS